MVSLKNLLETLIYKTLKKSYQLAAKIREIVVEMAFESGASHIGSALSIVDILAVLYGSKMKLKPDSPSWKERDRFILSKGHACMAVYATLAELGFIERSFLKEYGKNDSILMNHISHKVPGVEFSTGSLGHGLPFAAGKSLAAKRSKFHWDVYAVLSDGELDEGSNWEAIMFSGFHKLNNLTAIIDFNNLQSLDTVDNTLSLEPLSQKFESFGWKAIEVNGHDHHELLNAFNINSNVPKAIIAKTVKGKGVSFMENKVEWHYKSPSEKEFKLAMIELNSQ